MDKLISNAQGFVGLNVFTYCINNPVNGCDPCGTCFHRWDFWNDCKACGGETIIDKWENYIENGRTLVGTIGGYISGNIGLYDFTGSVECALDLKGNIQVVGSGSFDITSSGSVSASTGLSGSLFVMPDTSYLAGDTYYIGGSAFVPNPTGGTAVGASGNVGTTSDGYWGLMGTVGIGTITASGVEFHGGYTRTVALTKQFNIFEFILKVF